MKIDEVLTVRHFFETKATGEFRAIPGMSEAMIDYYELLHENGKQIGTAANQYPITQIKMPNGQYLVGLYSDRPDMLVAICKYQVLSLWNRKYIDVILIHSLSDFAGRDARFKPLVNKNLIMVLLEFMKDHYNLPFIESYGEQSNDAIRLIKIASRANKTHWLNIKTEEMAEYDPAKDNPKKGMINEPFRSPNQKTDWRIVIESSGVHDVDDYSVHEGWMRKLQR